MRGSLSFQGERARSTKRFESQTSKELDSGDWNDFEFVFKEHKQRWHFGMFKFNLETRLPWRLMFGLNWQIRSVRFHSSSSSRANESHLFNVLKHFLHNLITAADVECFGSAIMPVLEKWSVGDEEQISLRLVHFQGYQCPVSV